VSFLGLPKASSTPGKEWVWIWEIFIAMTMLVEGIAIVFSLHKLCEIYSSSEQLGYHS
jgi:hypothetical protein